MSSSIVTTATVTLPNRRYLRDELLTLSRTGDAKTIANHLVSCARRQHSLSNSCLPACSGVRQLLIDRCDVSADEADAFIKQLRQRTLLEQVVAQLSTHLSSI